MNKNNGLSLLLLVAPALFLPGCAPLDWVKKQFGGAAKKEMAETLSGDTSQVLVTIDGKPAVTVNKLEKEFDKLVQENPQLKQLVPYMPQIKKNFLSGLVSQELVNYWVSQNSIDEKSDYKQEMERTLEQARRAVNAKFFSKAHPVNVTKAEVKEFYEKNKDTMPELLVSRGGVKTKAVAFEKQDVAKDFINKIKEAKSIEKAAKQAEVEKRLKDFKLVNQDTPSIDTELRKKVVAVKSVPVVDMVKGEDGKFWVFYATKREQAEYQPFEKVKGSIEQHLTNQKNQETLEKALEELKKEYNVEVDESYFKAQEEEASAKAKQAAEKAKKAQEKAKPAAEKKQKKPAGDKKEAAQKAAPAAKAA